MTPLQIIQDIYTVAKAIHNAAETVKANKVQCQTLTERIQIVTETVKGLEKVGNLEQYRAGLESLQACVQKCASFVNTFSNNHWFKNILKGGSHKDKFALLNKKLLESAELLGLGLGAQQIVNHEKDIEDEAKDRKAILQQQQSIVTLNIQANQKIEQVCLEQADQKQILQHMFNSMKAQFERLANVSAKPLIDAHLETAYYELTFKQKLHDESASKVYIGQWHDQEVAIKTLEGEIPQNEWNEFVREVKIISRLRNEHIVQLYAVCFEQARPCLVMQYMKQDSLYKVLMQNILTSSQKKQIALDIARGLSYLHRENIIHRDLKSANILLSDYRAKIADFGLSKIGSRSIQSACKKSTAIEWMAPELLQGTSSASAESDIYSFGMILWELTTNKRPYAQFTGANREMELIKYLLAGNQETITPAIPSFYAELIRACWNKNPTQRISLRELIDKLEAYEPEKKQDQSNSIYQNQVQISFWQQPDQKKSYEETLLNNQELKSRCFGCCEIM